MAFYRVLVWVTVSHARSAPARGLTFLRGAIIRARLTAGCGYGEQRVSEDPEAGPGGVESVEVAE